MAGGFQSVVNVQPAPAVAGDFCDANPRWTVDAGAGALVAGPSGVAVGRFCWNTAPDDPNGFGAVVNNYGAGPVLGFVARAQQGLITQYLADASMVIPQGFAMSVFSGGGFWVVNSGSGQALPGMKAYANNANGLATFAATGAPSTTTQTSATIATGTAATLTGSIAGNILTASAVTNTIYAGALVAGGTVATGTQIVFQISGTAGGAGTYYVNIPEQTVAAAALTATPYLAQGTGGAGIVVGSTITATSTGATGTIVGAQVTAIITPGTDVVVAMPYPGTGTNTTATLTFGLNIETKWVCMSSGLPGELVKIQSHPLG